MKKPCLETSLPSSSPAPARPDSLPIRNGGRLFRLLALPSCAALALSLEPAQADGIYRNGAGARSIALGGADTALADDPLSIMNANPAGLGYVTNVAFSAGVAGGSLDGKFVNSANSNGHPDSTPGVFPEGALTASIPHIPVQFGLSVIPTALLSADWHYVDAPGGAGGKASYGPADEQSQITLLRSALGAGYQICPAFSLGASLGFLYNENVLKAPYVFQSGPLKTDKVLLNLHTAGLGFDGQGGFLVRPADGWQIGVSYHSESVIKSSGTAYGNAGAQLGLPPSGSGFNYNSTVLNTFPQSVSGGVQWQAMPKLKLLAQVDWVNWSSAFHNLRIGLTDGSSPLPLPGAFNDSVPLDWKDEFVYRAGVEYEVIKSLSVRAGYSYSPSPVPSGTLTPLTAAIFEHALAAGVGWHCGTCALDLAYEYDLPVTETVGTSALLDGEYSNSKVRVSAQWVALTFTKSF